MTHKPTRTRRELDVLRMRAYQHLMNSSVSFTVTPRRSEIAKELGVSRSTLIRWDKRYQEAGDTTPLSVFQNPRKPTSLLAREMLKMLRNASIGCRGVHELKFRDAVGFQDLCNSIFDKPVSTTLVRKRLKENGIDAQRPSNAFLSSSPKSHAWLKNSLIPCREKTHHDHIIWLTCRVLTMIAPEQSEMSKDEALQKELHDRRSFIMVSAVHDQGKKDFALLSRTLMLEDVKVLIDDLAATYPGKMLRVCAYGFNVVPESETALEEFLSLPTLRFKFVPDMNHEGMELKWSGNEALPSPRETNRKE